MTDLPKMDRRAAIKWMLAASATITMLENRSFGAAKVGNGYGSDPNLMDVHHAGEFWPLTFDQSQRKTAAALCDLIIPSDDKSPSASKVGVHDFIDEWISAPYPKQQIDRKLILDGLKYLDRESTKRFKKSFAEIEEKSQRLICDEICYLPKASPKLQEQARFFARFRNLTAGGFYTTPEGMKDVQYLGNVPLTKFDGPPPEVLAYLKLT